MPKALITGVTGQDGSYLSELLISKGYEIHGIKRRSSSFNTSRVDHLIENPLFHLRYGDVTDARSIDDAVREIQPDEVYNLAAQSHVGVSFQMPDYTMAATGHGAANVFGAVRRFAPEARVYQASSSEMFGNEPAPQGITTRFSPQSPYGAAKVYAHNMAQLYRDAYGLRITCGILFNHESPRRGETFVTRKIAMAAARIKAGLQGWLVLGNLEARRDWGWAPDYVAAMWNMVQSDCPVAALGTGDSWSVRDFARQAFAQLDMDWERYVETDDRYQRPAEIHQLRAVPSAMIEHTVSFAGLVQRMVQAEMEALKR
jgi:GDPmannose 4,6-dehydratase